MPAVPVAFNDGGYSVVHGQALNISAANGVLANDTDADNDTLTATIVSYPSHGYFAFANDGSFTYLLNSDYSGSDSFTYKASDGTTDSNTATVSLSYTNTAPSATGGSLSIGHDQVLTIDFSDYITDADGDALTFAWYGGPTHGALVDNGDGTGKYYTLAGWTGTDNLNLIGNDGVEDSDPAGLTITVTNTTPTASNATLHMVHDSVLPGVNLNQYVADEDGDPLQISIVSGPSHGDWTQNADGTYIYTPAANFTGSGTITFKANDGAEDSSTATLTIVVSQYAPSSDNTYSLIHDRTLHHVNFAQNDGDAANDPWAIQIVAVPAHALLTRKSDGTFDFAPDEHFYGTDTVTISANEGDAVVVTFEVTNHAPIPKDTEVPLKAYCGSYEGLEFLVGVTDSDNDALTFEIISGPEHGSLDFNSSTGMYDYHADASFLGRDNFSIRYYDGAQYTSQVTADILVYDDTTDTAVDSYVQGFALLPTAAFNGDPDGLGIRQGVNNADCWFVATEVGLAQARPTVLAGTEGDGKTPIIRYNCDSGAGRNYTVFFPNGTGWRATFTFTFVRQTYTNPDDAALQISLSRSTNNNGDWSAILEQAYAGMLTPTNDLTWAQRINRILNRGELADVPIRALTGEATHRSFPWSADWRTHNRLVWAFANNKVVTASTSEERGQGHGLEAPHCYTVLGYNATTEEVHLRNPWGFNDPYDVVIGPGNQTVRRRPLGNGAADFWLPLADFTNWFEEMNYQI